MLPVRAGVAEIFRRAGAPFRERREGRIDAGRLKVMAAIEACRTAVLGGHMYRCDGCGREHPLHNSCRNRHCPTCQGLAAIVIDGAADGLAVNGQGAVCRAVGLVPRPQSGIELDRVDTDQQAAHRRQAGRAVLAVAAAHAEALQHPGAELRNIGASVRARFLQRARAEETDLQILLTRYALERLLYRLSVSDHRQRFVLNAAMLFAPSQYLSRSGTAATLPSWRDCS